jgi:hypothetical protein
LELPCDGLDKDLFVASTVVTIGDNKTVKFWTSSWVQGKAPKSFAPTLLKKAKRKNVTVQKAVQDNKGISHITPILTRVKIQEYVRL